jgi:hypothetical protein
VSFRARRNHELPEYWDDLARPPLALPAGIASAAQDRAQMPSGMNDALGINRVERACNINRHFEQSINSEAQIHPANSSGSLICVDRSGRRQWKKSNRRKRPKVAFVTAPCRFPQHYF